MLIRTHYKKWFSLFFSGALLATTCLAENPGLPTLGDPTLQALSPKEEARLGKSFYLMLKTNLDFVEDIQVNHYLNSLAQRLVSNAGSDKTFRFFILNTNTINAFAGPDAYIGIHSGLVLEARNESQLASVLAHEIAHVTQRHIARAYGRSGNAAAISFATILAAILLATQNPEAGQAALVTGMAGTQQASLNFTRKNEYEADRIGIGILTDAGINPEGMVDFFQLLLDKSSGHGLEYLRTHPLSSNRVSEAKDRITTSQLTLPTDSSDFHFFQARIEVLTSNDPETLTKVVSNDKMSEYRRAVALLVTDRAAEATKLLRTLVSKYDHPWLKLSYAKALSQNGEHKKALDILQHLMNLYPQDLPMALAYAELLLLNNQVNKSITLLKHQLQKNNIVSVHKLLAKAYFANGQIVAALESTGNQYQLQGFTELAIQQYDNALQQPGLSATTTKRLLAKKERFSNSLKHEKLSH